MSCRESAAGSALTTLARLTSGLPDRQVLSAYHALRNDGQDFAAPNQQQWEQFIEQQREVIASAGFTDARQASLNRRLDRAAEEIPDGRSFYALARIREVTARQNIRLNDEFGRLAGELSSTIDGQEEQVRTLRARYAELEENVPRGRSAAAPEGYDDAAIAQARRDRLPIDRGSVTALNTLRQEVRRERANRVLNGPQRIERQVVDSTAIRSVGYDPDGGRLEVTFPLVGGEESRVYAYRNVPAETYAAMIGGSAGETFNREVRGRNEYRYADQTEADLDSAARQCGDCGQFAAASHTCPVRVAAAEAAAQAEAAANATTEAALPVEQPAEPRPEPRRYWGSTTHVYSREEGARGYVRLPRASAIRAESGDGPRNATCTYSEGYGPNRINASLNIVYDRPRRGVHTMSENTPQCTCEAFQNNGDCAHLTAIRAQTVQLLPETQRPGAAPRERRRAVPVAERREETARSAVGTRYRYVQLGNTSNTGYRYRSDSIAMPRSITELRAEAAVGPTSFTSTASGYRGAGDEQVAAGNLTAGSFQTSTVAVYDRPRRGVHTLTFRESQCNCAQYQQHGNCPHVRLHQNHLRATLLPASQMPSTAEMSAEEALEAERTAAYREEQARLAEEAAIRRAQEEAEAAARSDFMNHAEMAADARTRWATAQDSPDNYSNNFNAFNEDYEAALARKAAGENPIEYMTENATGGLCTREAQRPFGIELEFDIGDGNNRSAALAAIGREMHAAGLTSTPNQVGYHGSERAGYTENHQGGWSFEQDCTVSGEIVSPIMYDEPQTWENIAKVCEIIKRNGGIANVRTGSHVHVGMQNTTPATSHELVRMANQHEDVMYRISQNPAAAQHRPMRWCGPNRDVPPTGYATTREAQYAHMSHNYGVNLQSVSGGTSDHAEIRHWDGSLDPSVIQAQVKISAAMVAAAERNGGTNAPGPVVREPSGAHATRLLAAGHTREAPAELRETDSASARSFADTLFTRREDKKQFAALFAITKWQRSDLN